MPVSPKLIRTADAMFAFSRDNSDKTIALVPTMGALHKGHHELVREARRHADVVAVSIFVNPTQFGPTEDLDRYPRQLGDDVAALAEQGNADVVFAPSVGEMYPDGEKNQQVWVTPDRMDTVLCGAFRPGHFRGVTTVVAKLFGICRPDVAVFGLKDAQQFVILRKMVRDLAMQTRLVGMPTVREEDGLALSSRNRYLTVEQRAEAVVLSKATSVAHSLVESGTRSADNIRSAMRREVEEASLAKIQYIDVVDAATLRRIDEIEPGQQVLAALAVFFGGTRLIDNSFSVAP